MCSSWFAHSRVRPEGRRRRRIKVMDQLRRVPISAMKGVIYAAVLSMVFAWTEATTGPGGPGGPIPAANLPEDCNSVERCCMPKPYTGKPGIRQFEYEPNLPIRVRRPAHLLTKKEIARLEKAYKLMKALPDTDPRSLLNQMNLHCLYCDNGLYFKGADYPLEVHHGWFFLPWHRMFMYFHERILGKLLGDDTFALPYWNWDNSEATDPLPNAIPSIYWNPDSPLYDPIRNNCSRPPLLVDLDTTGGCTNKTSDFIRVQNTRLQYTQIVLGGDTPMLFYGMPYRLGDFGGGGPGTFEDQPHGTIHAWVGDPTAQSPYHSFDDMGNFGRSAYDPLFYAHHANVDRLWCLWTHLREGKRTYPKDSDFLTSQFTFYDQDGNLVKMNVTQTLDTDLLRYKFEDSPTPWKTNGVAAGNEFSIPRCNPASKSTVNKLIAATAKHNSKDILNITPLTFKVRRPTRRSAGTEVLEISGLQIPNITLQAHWKAYLFYPQVNFTNGAICPEFVGTYNFIPHVGQALYNPKRVWRVSVGPKLKALGLDYVRSVIVTLVQPPGPFLQDLKFTKAKILYDTSG